MRRGYVGCICASARFMYVCVCDCNSLLQVGSFTLVGLHFFAIFALYEIFFFSFQLLYLSSSFLYCLVRPLLCGSTVFYLIFSDPKFKGLIHVRLISSTEELKIEIMSRLGLVCFPVGESMAIYPSLKPSFLTSFTFFLRRSPLDCLEQLYVSTRGQTCAVRQTLIWLERMW